MVDRGTGLAPSRVWRASLVVILLAVTPGRSPRAQLSGRPTETADTTMQRLCVSAAAAVQGMAPEAITERQREIMSVCELSGPPVIADEWARVSGPGPALAYLIDASSYIRDERLFQAAQSTALDEGRDPAVRIAAVNVLTHYAVPTSARWPLIEDPVPMLDFASDREDTVTGGQPLVGDLAARLDAVLQQLAIGGGVTISRVDASAYTLAAVLRASSSVASIFAFNSINSGALPMNWSAMYSGLNLRIVSRHICEASSSKIFLRSSFKRVATFLEPFGLPVASLCPLTNTILL